MILKDTDSSECIALTGKQCRYSQTERIKREAAEEDTEFKIKTDRVLFYSSKSLSFKVKLLNLHYAINPIINFRKFYEVFLLSLLCIKFKNN